jgi:hypothetical protein
MERKYRIKIIDSSYYGWQIYNGMPKPRRVHFFSVDHPFGPGPFEAQKTEKDSGEYLTCYYIGCIENTSQPNSEYDEILEGSEEYLKSVWEKKVRSWLPKQVQEERIQASRRLLRRH